MKRGYNKKSYIPIIVWSKVDLDDFRLSKGDRVSVIRSLYSRHFIIHEFEDDISYEVLGKSIGF